MGRGRDSGTRGRSWRPLCAIALLGLAALAACGGDSDVAAPGSPERPLVGRSQEKPTAGRRGEAAAPTSKAKPGYRRLVKRQSRRPRHRFSPCNLVTAREARAILGARIEPPREAPQGPTCIYRDRGAKRFVTLVVQPVSYKRVKRQLGQPRRIAVGRRTAYCGRFGRPTLHVPLRRRRVLSVTASCRVAERFAAKALRRMRG